MANFIRSYKKAGLSSTAIAGASRQSSTRIAYNYRIRKYIKWCIMQTEVSLYRATLGQVCDFFTWEFAEEKANVNATNAEQQWRPSIMGLQTDGFMVSTSPVVHDFNQGIFHQRPPAGTLVLAWDLPRTPCLLAEPPFEPLDQTSMTDITTKTAFFVAVASGRRMSATHALSVAKNHIDFQDHAVHLFPGLTSWPRTRLRTSLSSQASYKTFASHRIQGL